MRRDKKQPSHASMNSLGSVELGRYSLRAGISSGMVLLLTSVHHIYGAIIYQTPWRYHVVIPSIVVMLFISGMLFLFRKRPDARLGALAFWLAVACIMIFPITWIGLFEGGYNHLIKNALYFSGASMALMRRFFSQPTYEMPDDVFFEVTGVLQLFAVLPAIYHIYRLIRAKVMTRKGREPETRDGENGRRILGSRRVPGTPQLQPRVAVRRLGASRASRRSVRTPLGDRQAIVRRSDTMRAPPNTCCRGARATVLTVASTTLAPAL